MLNKDKILKADDLSREFVGVPEWGGEGEGVWVSTMTGAQRDAFEDSIFQTKGKNVTQNLKNYRSKLCVQVIVDETGTRLFEDGDIEALAKKSAKVLDRIVTVAQRLNGIGSTDVEDLTKN